MLTNLLLKFSSQNKTSKLTLCRNNGKTARPAARHPSVTPGLYVFDKVIYVHESHSEVRGLIGTKMLMFRRQGSLGKVLLYPGSSMMVPLQDAIAVSTPDFLEICAGVVRGATTLEVKSAMFLWGSQPLQGEAISMVYRHLFDVPLESFEEPTEEAKRRAEREAREKARRREESQAREAALRAAQQAAQQATPSRQRTSNPSRPAQPARPAAPSTRPVHRSLPRNTPRRDDDDSLADFMFMSMFPEVAPLYRPNSFMAWYLWSQQQDNRDNQPFAGAGGQFDGGGASGDWTQGVPGFPDAVSQRVTQHGDSQRVELIDAHGRSVGSFVVTENNGQTQFTAPGGHVFTVADQAANPTIEYASQSGQRFYWDGENEPVVESTQDNSTAAFSASEQSFFTDDSSRSSNTESFGTVDTQNDTKSMDSATAY